MMRHMLFCLLLCASIFFSSASTAKPLHVVFINPGHPTGDKSGAFWSTVDLFMRAAAKDLSIELTILHARRHHLQMKRLAGTVRQHNPDYVIIVNEKGIGSELVEKIATRNTPIFFLLNTLNQSEIKLLRRHEQALLSGSLIPDNTTAGYELMYELVAAHRSVTPPRPLNAIALLGDYSSPAAISRQQGMLNFIKDNSDITLIDATVANWSKQAGYKKTKGLLKREHIDLIWAANDAIASGASQAVKEAKLNRKVTIGGFNWDKQDHKYPIDVSLGGHVVLGAKALVMLNDIHDNTLLPCERNVKQNVFRPISQTDLQAFHRNTAPDKIDEFDFLKFSKSNAHYSKFDIDVFITKDYKPKTVSELPVNCKL